MQVCLVVKCVLLAPNDGPHDSEDLSPFIYSFVSQIFLNICFMSGAHLVPGNSIVFKTEIMTIRRLCLQDEDEGRYF